MGGKSIYDLRVEMGKNRLALGITLIEAMPRGL